MKAETITPLRAFLRASTPEEREALAAAAGTTLGQLNQLAGGHRSASADLAGRLETGIALLRRTAATKKRLPEVVRTDLCAACRDCPYAAKVLKGRVITSEFPIHKE